MPDFNTLVKVSPIILVFLIFLLQQRIVVTPEQLEKKHREILQDAENKFATINQVTDLKSDFKDMKDKIDKIYDKVMGVVE